MAKRALAILFIFLSLLLSVSSSVLAQTADPDAAPWSNTNDAQQVETYRAAITADNCATPSLECLVHQTFRFVAIEFVNSTMWRDEIEPNLSGNSEPASSLPGGGILIGAGQLIEVMYSYPAANTGTYIADILDSAHITPKAYAQGIGFSALNPILELWKAFRNIAYMFFVVIFIVIGFMIMFRKQMSGQGAITAQKAIPQVIISLILVTFSYAIAGFMIDLMYLLMFLIIGVFGQTLPDTDINIIDMTILQVFGALFTASEAGNVLQNANIISNLFGSLIANDSVNGFLSIAGGLTLSVILAVAILIGTVKLFFELLKSYASIVMSVVLSPIILMTGAIPGRNPVVGWLKDLVGHLLAFPTVLLVLVLFYQFNEVSSGGNDGGFIPPFLIARGASGAIASLMGLALILALPEIVKDVKKNFVSEGFGTTIFKAATESIKDGWRGGQPISGVPVKVPGAKTIAETVIAGPKKLRGGYKTGTAYLRKGLASGAYERARNAYRNRSIDKNSVNVDSSQPQTQSQGPSGENAQQGRNTTQL